MADNLIDSIELEKLPTHVGGQRHGKFRAKLDRPGVEVKASQRAGLR